MATKAISSGSLISLNPTAPDFTYRESSSASTSIISSAATNSSHTSRTSLSSQCTLPSTKSTLSFYPTLPPKEFIPQNPIVLASHPTPMSPPPPPISMDTPSHSDDQRSESTFSLGHSSNPSDTTFTTQDSPPSPKREDILLSMK
jgi:hypothetical protein